VREFLEQLGSSAFLDRCPAVDDDVLAQARGLDPCSLEGERNAGVVPDVLKLALTRIEMRCEQLVTLDRIPNARHLRAPVPVARDQVAEGACPNELFGAASGRAQRCGARIARARRGRAG
jgi:hypothetical protein